MTDYPPADRREWHLRVGPQRDIGQILIMGALFLGISALLVGGAHYTSSAEVSTAPISARIFALLVAIAFVAFDLLVLANVFWLLFGSEVVQFDGRSLSIQRQVWRFKSGRVLDIADPFEIRTVERHGGHGTVSRRISFRSGSVAIETLSRVSKRDADEIGEKLLPLIEATAKAPNC